MSDMDGWMDVAAAAQTLDVSTRQVRSLIERGTLPAQRVGGSWLVAADAVRSRAAHSPTAGRPVSPELAWLLLAVAQHQIDQNPGDGSAVLNAVRDRRLRHRLRQLLDTPTSASGWARWVGRRADRQRYWVHPGVVPRLEHDLRLRAGGSTAAAAAGIGITAGTPSRFYVDVSDLAAVEAKYRLTADPTGQIELMVVPAGIPRDLLTGQGPVPAAVALADLLESDDARERHEAATRLERVTLRPTT